MNQNPKQLYRPPDLLKDSEADIARWLAQQEPADVVARLAPAIRDVKFPLFGIMVLPLVAAVICFLIAGLVTLSIMGFCALGGFLIFHNIERFASEQRRAWLREQLLVRLEHGGREIPLSLWIVGMGVLHTERRRSYEALARRLATATSGELQALTQDERAALRELLKEWPGEALQIALLLALGTAGDIFAKPYARRLVTNPTESEAVREAAEECLRSLERAS